MSAPQTPERPARDGETCSCGRPAVTVYQTAKFGDVPFCGVEGGGHSDPQTPPPCPVEWCEVKHEDEETPWMHRRTLINWHSPDATGATGVIVRLRQFGDDVPYITLWGYHDPQPVSEVDSVRVQLDAGQARLLAAIATPDEVADALREAADELDRITSGGAS